jgi:hypothetical protein
MLGSIISDVEALLGPEATTELRRRVLRVDEIAMALYGTAPSREIVAVVIEQWERDGKP